MRLFSVLFSFLCLLFVTPGLTMTAKESPPNIVLVMCDDLGYGDLACYGSPTVKTPHIDAFAKRGMRFTNFYSAAPNCSPSRTGLMTGRTPTRLGIHNWIPWDSPMHVTRKETTVATLLRNSGYDTCLVGKWHINGGFHKKDQPQPDEHGFNHWMATQNNAIPTHHNPDNFYLNGKAVGKIEGFAANIVTDEAMDKERREKGKLVHGTVDGADPEAFFGSRLAQVVVESEYPSPELAFPKDFPEGGGGESKLQGRLKQSKNRKKSRKKKKKKKVGRKKKSRGRN